MAANHHHVLNAESEQVLPVVYQEGHPDTSPSRVFNSKDSDFFPSIILAAVLIFIFIFALPMLSQPGMVFVPFRNLDKISRTETNFHPLLYIQPWCTQHTIERLAKNREETLTVLAVAKEHATQTLVCFSKNVIALLTKQDQSHLVIRQVVEVKTLKDIWKISNTRASDVFSVSVMTHKTGHVPHCTILRLTSPATGNIHLTEILPAQEREVTIHKESSIIAHELLELVYKTGQVPETFEVKGSIIQHVKVLHVLDDPYLESGIVC